MDKKTIFGGAIIVVILMISAKYFVSNYSFSPKEKYQSCVIDNIHKTKSNLAAKYVKEACHDKAYSDSAKEVKQAKCQLKGVLKVKNDVAARTVYHACIN